jgi:hypothetical protein
VSSASHLDVLLSETARSYLLSLSAKDAEAIAVHLLTFYKNGTPPHSRVLTALTAETNDRVWIVGEYEILYRLLVRERRVEIGIIRPVLRTAPSKRDE